MAMGVMDMRAIWMFTRNGQESSPNLLLLTLQSVLPLQLTILLQSEIFIQKPRAMNGNIKQTTFVLLSYADRSTYSLDFLEVAKCGELYRLRAVLYLLLKINFLEDILRHKPTGSGGKDEHSKILTSKTTKDENSAY
ncbi:MAG: hypothetical protein K9J75_10740 [Cyanobium usitatum Tobar12.5m-G36]|nr:hypothetical protein [Cyanobium usitatum Tobar12.5m-G36]